MGMSHFWPGVNIFTGDSSTDTEYAKSDYLGLSWLTYSHQQYYLAIPPSLHEQVQLTLRAIVSKYSLAILQDGLDLSRLGNSGIDFLLIQYVKGTKLQSH
jgi:hypothetical protein